jgi:hypothetical protein
MIDELAARWTTQEGKAAESQHMWHQSVAWRGLLSFANVTGGTATVLKDPSNIADSRVKASAYPHIVAAAEYRKIRSQGLASEKLHDTSAGKDRVSALIHPLPPNPPIIC